MADALVSIINEQAQSIIKGEFKLIKGVDDELRNISTTLIAIQVVLKDAEERGVKEGPVKVWLAELKDISYSIDDVLDEWITRNLELQIEVHDNSALIHKVCTFFHCFCLDEGVLHEVLLFLSRFGLDKLILCHKIAHRIKNIRKSLDWIAIEKDKYNFNISESTEESTRIITSSITDISKVCGRDQDKEALISKLLSESSYQTEGVPVISIVGTGGLGKTTLAQLVFSDYKVKTHFDKRIWVCVSDPFDKTRVTKAILEAIGQELPKDGNSWDALHQCLCRSVEGKVFLLVLDDMWTEDYQKWEPLRVSLNFGAPGSRIVVTTRNVRVTIMMGSIYIHNLEILSEDDTWAILGSIALFGRGVEEQSKLEETGKKIALKCKGLPLIATTLGGLLRFKRTKRDWLNVLESETWNLEEIRKDVLPALLLSYYDLPSQLKCCFTYCAVFLKGQGIERKELIGLWMAQGFLGLGGEEEMESLGGECFDNLVMRSLFLQGKNDTPSNYYMHDVVHDFVQFLTKEECLIYPKRKLDLGHLAKTRHVTLLCNNIKDTVPSLCKAANLRTLQIHQFYENCFGGLFPVSICNLTSLRSLDLSRTDIEKVPSQIEKLIHLRYLNLSVTEIKKLPETVSKLHNLQTLDLRDCRELVKLPRGIVNLKKMRFLDISGTSNLTYLPRGLGRLRSLRTLTKFIVGGHHDGCETRELKNLNHLTGCLKIEGLGNVWSTDEAGELNLRNKDRLQELELDFDGKGVRRDRYGTSERVLKELQAHPNLEALTISSYPGTKFPKDWMKGNDGLPLYPNLRHLKLSDCRDCSRLFLPELPSLEVLEIKRQEAVTHMDESFFGISGEMRDINVMPNLHKLTLSKCSNLKVLPPLLSGTGLRVLCVEECRALSWTS